jgi:hypothetical protein
VRHAGNHLRKRAVFLELHFGSEHTLFEFLLEHELSRGTHHLHEVGEHGRKQLRRAWNRVEKMVAAKDEQLRGRYDSRRGIAIAAVEKGELTERIAGTRTSKLDLRTVFEFLGELDLTRQHAVQLVSRLALPEDYVPSGDGDGLSGICHSAKQFIRDIREQRRSGNSGTNERVVSRRSRRRERIGKCVDRHRDRPCGCHELASPNRCRGGL